MLVAGGEGGIIEPICNAISLHQIKKQNKSGSLLDYFRREFGATNSERFLTAQKNFVHSCAAYCLICYFIRVKDRWVLASLLHMGVHCIVGTHHVSLDIACKAPIMFVCYIILNKAIAAPETTENYFLTWACIIYVLAI